MPKIVPKFLSALMPSWAPAHSTPVVERGIPPQMIGTGSSDIMVDPVLASDGHHYERLTLNRLLRGPKPRSPVTGELLKDVYTPAIALRDSIDAFLAAHPELGPQLSRQQLAAVDFVQAAGVDRARAVACARRLRVVNDEHEEWQIEELLKACTSPDVAEPVSATNPHERRLIFFLEKKAGRASEPDERVRALRYPRMGWNG
jgi:hypothetical protein